MSRFRTDVKRVLARAGAGRQSAGATLLIYHRVGGGSPDELDVPAPAFETQMDALAEHRVEHLDAALDRLDAGDRAGTFVVTFDDGFGDVFDRAWPIMRERRIPFTVYVTSSCIGASMTWAGSTAKEIGAPALTWAQLETMVASGLCTVGNHTHTHARPELLSEAELDHCSALVRDWLGVTPRHYAYTWGIPVPSLDKEMRRRFRSAATGRLGRNLPGADLMRLARVPVRRSDPIDFFRAKLAGGLLPERMYGGIVTMAKRVGVGA